MTAAGVSHRADRLPWQVAACGLVAMGAAYLIGGRPPLLLLLAAGLTASTVIPGRLTWGFWPGLLVRVILMALVVVLMGVPAEGVEQWYVKPAYTSRLAVLLAAELVLRAWTKPDKPNGLGALLLVSGGILMCAANTMDRGVMAVAVPLFALAALQAVRRMSTADRLGGWRWAMAALALMLGFALVELVRAADREITNWAVNLVQTAPSRRSQIGMGMSPRLQAIFNPDRSAGRVMRLDGFRGERHIRVAAYTTYFDGMWLPQENDRDYRPVNAAVLRGEVDEDGNRLGGEWGRRVRVTPLAPVLTSFVGVPVDAVAVDLPVPADRDSTGTVRLIRGEVVSSYEVLMGGDELRIPLLPAPVSPMREVLLTVPSSIDLRVAQLARELVAGETDPEQRVRRIVRHLRDNHGYSLSYMPEGEPLSDFILRRRAAHCQYFASAVVVMCRMVGVPARFVSGFLAHEPESDRSTIVRQRDAHAWAEVYIEGRGWFVADATPAGGLPNGLFADVSPWRRAWEAITDFPGTLRARIEGLELEVAALWTLGLAAAAWGGYAAWRAWRRRKPPVARAPGTHPDLLAAAQRFERLLARSGRPCPDERTWREHVTFWPQAGVFLDCYEAARYGRGDAGEVLRVLKTLPPPPRPPVP